MMDIMGDMLYITGATIVILGLILFWGFILICAGVVIYNVVGFLRAILRDRGMKRKLCNNSMDMDKEHVEKDVIKD